MAKCFLIYRFVGITNYHLCYIFPPPQSSFDLDKARRGSRQLEDALTISRFDKLIYSDAHSLYNFFSFFIQIFVWCMTQIHWGGREQKIPVGQTFHQIFFNCFMFHSSFMLLHICILHVMKDFFLQILIFCILLGRLSVHDPCQCRHFEDVHLTPKFLF